MIPRILLVTLSLSSALLIAGEGGSLSGRIVKADGSPAAGVEVCLSPLDSKEIVAVTTDATGAYRFESLPPGSYLLYVLETPRRKGGPPPENPAELEALLQEALAESAAIRSGHPVSIGAGKAATCDLRLPLRVSLRGCVLHLGKPVAGAEVRVSQEDGVLPWPKSAGEAAKTDGSGCFVVLGIAPGRYRLSLRVGGSVVEWGECEVSADPAARPVDLVLGARAVHVRLLHADGTPVTRASFWAGLKDKDYGGVEVEEEESPAGEYEIPYLGDGEHSVDAFAADGDGSASTDVKLTEKETPVTLHFPPLGEIVVKVVDAAGKPVSGAHVDVERAARSPAFGRETDAAGQVRLRLTPGEWTVILADERNPMRAAIPPRTVTLEAGKTMEVTLAKP